MPVPQVRSSRYVSHAIATQSVLAMRLLRLARRLVPYDTQGAPAHQMQLRWQTIPAPQRHHELHTLGVSTMTSEQYAVCYHFARRLGMHHHDAQDAAQTVALRALEHMPADMSEKEQSAWLIVVLRNRYYSEWRAFATKLRLDHLIDYSESQPCSAIDKIQIDQLIAALKPIHSEVLIRAVCGDTIDEIAAELCIPTGTVKSRMSRARAALACT